jgi:hypothetical protein
MGVENLYIQVDDTEGHALGAVVDDENWARERAGRGAESPVILRPADDADEDVEGHAAGTSVRLRAFDDESDTEGHAISINFPTREEADAFRRRLMLAGVLTGTIALGAAAGAGLSSMSQAPAEGNAAGGAAGMDWTQPERPDLAAGAGAGSAAGMDWTQMERQDQSATDQGNIPSDPDFVKRGPTPE